MAALTFNHKKSNYSNNTTQCLKTSKPRKNNMHNLSRRKSNSPRKRSSTKRKSLKLLSRKSKTLSSSNKRMRRNAKKTREPSTHASSRNYKITFK